MQHSSMKTSADQKIMKSSKTGESEVGKIDNEPTTRIDEKQKKMFL
jgi:hypothetical protein